MGNGKRHRRTHSAHRPTLPSQNHHHQSSKPSVKGAGDIARIEISALKPDPTNARSHPRKHVEQIAASITAFGFNVPILIDAERQVIAGHGRLLAAQHLGWTVVPTITLEHLTPAQVKAYRIADNRLTDCSMWNERLLAEQLMQLTAMDLDFDLTAIGFELPEIDLRIQGLSELDGDVSDLVDEPIVDGPTIAQPGETWLLGKHRLVCGSALDPNVFAALMQGDRASMVFTDPPYNVPIAGHVSGKGAIQHAEFLMASGEMSRQTFTAFLGQSLAMIKQASKPGALIYACMDWRHLTELSTAGEAQGLELKNLVVWDKGCGGMGSLYRSQHELVFVFKNGVASHTNNVQLGRFGRNRTNVWAYPGVNSFARDTAEGNLLALHPTVKPVALVADAILDASVRGGIVLDPFLGSGTTILAAEKTGRCGYGIELDPRYVDTAIRRWQQFTGRQAVRVPDGTYFDALAAIAQRKAAEVEVEGASRTGA
jgi:DNA modification methylase